MKKLYFVALGCLISATFPICGQNRLIQEDRIWEYFNYLGQSCWYEQFCFDGTQEIEGKTYHQWKLINKISWTTYPETEAVETPVNEVTALLREEDGKVYMLISGDNVREYDSETRILSAPFVAPEGKESVLYDFTISEGESFPGMADILWLEEWTDLTQTALSNCTVTETGSMSVADSTVRKFTIQPDVSVALVENLDKIDISEPAAVDVEIKLSGDGTGDTSNTESQTLMTYAEVLGNFGRGNMTSLMPSYALFLTSGFMDYHVSYLSSVYDTDGTVIYGEPSAVSHPTVEATVKSGKIYDLYGRQVTNTIPGSIYIRDGRKFVAR